MKKGFAQSLPAFEDAGVVLTEELIAEDELKRLDEKILSKEKDKENRHNEIENYSREDSPHDKLMKEIFLHLEYLNIPETVSRFQEMELEIDPDYLDIEIELQDLISEKSGTPLTSMASTIITNEPFRTSCTAHTLQLVVKDGLKVVEVFYYNPVKIILIFSLNSFM